MQEKKAEAVSLDKKTDEVNPAEDRDEDMDDDLPLQRAAKKWKLTFPSDDEKGTESAMKKHRLLLEVFLTITSPSC